MKSVILGLVALFLLGCGQQGAPPEAPVAAADKPLLNVKAPDPVPMPDRMVPSSDTDWKAKVNNKDIEIIQIINIVNPVAAFITEGFKQYGDRFSDQLQEEWHDTQLQLGKALTLYGSCKERKAKGAFDKKLFLDMEEVWQLLVKTGVAGVRAKTMVDSEIRKLTRV
jgi:hypothetical protein